MHFADGLNEARGELILSTQFITDELLFHSVSVQLADMTTEAFLSPLYAQFVQALGVILNSPKDNIVVFSVEVRTLAARVVCYSSQFATLLSKFRLKLMAERLDVCEGRKQSCRL